MACARFAFVWHWRLVRQCDSPLPPGEGQGEGECCMFIKRQGAKPLKSGVQYEDKYLAFMGLAPKRIPHWEHWSNPDAETYLTGIVTVHGPGNRQKVFLWADDNSLRA